MKSIVRAVDLGFGNVKYIEGASRDVIRCASFPALAPLADEKALDARLFARPNTVIVEAMARRYEVGPGVSALGRAGQARILREDYLRTPQYLALMRGVLHYMKLPAIDLLVVGLPLGHATTRGAELGHLLRGTHPAVGDRSVEVRDVCCLPQPVGGFLHHAALALDVDRVRRETTLVIDVGFFTLDWLVCNGFRPMLARSGHVEGGVSSVLRALADAIGVDHDVHYTNLAALDHALRTGNLNLFGRHVAVAPYLGATEPAIEGAVNQLCNGVGAGADLDNVVVVGGGARLYLREIERRFPRHQVHVSTDPIFANVRGFQLAGTDVAHRRQVA
jgi:plasmid segregation protein ParM